MFLPTQGGSVRTPNDLVSSCQPGWLTTSRFAAHAYTISYSNCSHLHSEKDKPSLFPMLYHSVYPAVDNVLSRQQIEKPAGGRQPLTHAIDPVQLIWPAATTMACTEVGILDTKKVFGGTASNHSSQAQSHGIFPPSFGFLISLSLLPVAHRPDIV